MSESHAEQLDPSVLGERIGDDRRPAADFPPDEALAVDDPNLDGNGVVVRDDVESRDERRADHDDGPTGGPSPALIDTGDDPDLRDDERQLVADEGDRDLSPEAGAVHIDDTTEPEPAS